MDDPIEGFVFVAKVKDGITDAAGCVLALA